MAELLIVKPRRWLRVIIVLLVIGLIGGGTTFATCPPLRPDWSLYQAELTAPPAPAPEPFDSAQATWAEWTKHHWDVGVEKTKDAGTATADWTKDQAAAASRWSKDQLQKASDWWEDDGPVAVEKVWFSRQVDQAMRFCTRPHS